MSRAARLDTSAPPIVTGCVRYDWQIMAAALAVGDGLVLNIGANEDPAQLRKRFGVRVENCDLSGWDEHMDRPNVVDRIFNCLDFPWPIEDDHADTVIFGDILEHFPEPVIVEALTEARRVAPTVAITVPEDTRIDPDAAVAAWKREAYNLHTTIITEDVITHALHAGGWHLQRLHRAVWGVGGDWGPDGLYGWCALAQRRHR